MILGSEWGLQDGRLLLLIAVFRSNAYTQPRARLEFQGKGCFPQLFCLSLSFWYECFSKIKWHFDALNSLPYNLILGHPMPVPHPSFLKPNQFPTQTSKLRVLVSSHSCVLEESSPLTLISWYIAEVTVAHWDRGGSGSPPLQRCIQPRIACQLQYSLSRHRFWTQQSQYKCWMRETFSFPSCASCVLG